METRLRSPRDSGPAYRRIADGLRGEILSGKWPPRTRLPGTGKLASHWKSSYCTTHNALQELVKEGWIERVRGSGTFVVDPTTRFTCAAIYQAFDIGSSEEWQFARSLQNALMKELARHGKEVKIFIDPRPLTHQKEILPELADAISRRLVQCVIAPTINRYGDGPMSRLALPTAFVFSNSSPNVVHFDPADLLRESVDRLVKQGCRTVGLIHNLASMPPDKECERIDSSFRRAVRKAGVATRDEWIRHPARYCRELPEFGYREFQRLWSLPNKPEGLIVFPDMVAAGATVAALELGVSEVTSQMKFVLHRNAGVRFLCPLSVTWAISDESVLAKSLVHMIERQFAGEKITPENLPFRFKEGTSSALDEK